MQGGYEKNRDFQPMSRLFSEMEMIQDRAIVTMEWDEETVLSFRMVPFPMTLSSP